MKKIIAISVLSLALVGCCDPKQLLCGPVNVESGNMQLVNKQCVFFGDTVTAFYTFKDTNNGKQYNYTANVIDGRVIMNLSTSDALSIANSQEAVGMSAAAVGIAAASAGRSSGRGGR